MKPWFHTNCLITIEDDGSLSVNPDFFAIGRYLTKTKRLKKGKPIEIHIDFSDSLFVDRTKVEFYTEGLKNENKKKSL